MRRVAPVLEREEMGDLKLLQGESDYSLMGVICLHNGDQDTDVVDFTASTV